MKRIIINTIVLSATILTFVACKAKMGLTEITEKAEQGYPEAQFKLGQYYDTDFHEPEKKVDRVKAFKWYLKSAEQGYTAAQVVVGVFYSGESFADAGVEQDYNKALVWFQKAADQGNADAQARLGDLYYNGRRSLQGKSIIPQDYAKAFEWYSKAAQQGNSRGELGLGMCYEKGHGVKKNIDTAIGWFKKAASHKDEFQGQAEQKIEYIENNRMILEDYKAGEE